MSAIEALRARGEHRVDPVRFRLIESMARRSAAHDGEARRLLDARLAQLLAAYADEVARRGRDTTDETQEAVRPSPATALSALNMHLARVASLPGERPTAPEGPTLTWFRQVWTRLRAERRLVQSLEKVPTNAGPLNSHHLVHQSLTLMRDASPEYLHRFMGYVDTLFWLDQAGTPPQGRERR